MANDGDKGGERGQRSPGPVKVFYTGQLLRARGYTLDSMGRELHMPFRGAGIVWNSLTPKTQGEVYALGRLAGCDGEALLTLLLAAGWQASDGCIIM